MKKLKIALYHFSPGGGATRAARQLAKSLVRDGHSVDIYYGGKERSSLFFGREAACGFEAFGYTKMAKPRLRPYILNNYAEFAVDAINLHRYDRLCRKIARIIDSKGYDIVWVDKCSIVSASYVLRYLKTPSVFYCQEPWRDGYETASHGHQYKESQRAKGLRGLYNVACRKPVEWSRRMLKTQDYINAISAAHILCNSRYSQGYIQKAYGIQPQVSYLGVDAEIFRPINVRKENVILSVGRLEARKRHELCVEAIALVPEEIRPELVIIAEYDQASRKKDLEKLASEKNVKIRFLFAVSDEELVLWLNRARAVTYTATNEPFGLVAIEAMSCGTPVIGVREGGLQESIEHNRTGLLVHADPAELAEAIQLLLLSDGEYGWYLGLKGREAVLEKWTWEKAKDRLVAHMRQILSADGRPKKSKKRPALPARKAV